MYNVDYYFGSTENTYDKVLDGLYTTEVHSFKTSSLPLAEFWKPENFFYINQLLRRIGWSAQEFDNSKKIFEFPVKPRINNQYVKKARPSMTDLMIRYNELNGFSDKQIAVEGKFTEDLYETIEEWKKAKNPYSNKGDVLKAWYSYIENYCDFSDSAKENINKHVVYQFLHRTASACYQTEKPVLLYHLFYDAFDKKSVEHQLKVAKRLISFAKDDLCFNDKIKFYIAFTPILNLKEVSEKFSDCHNSLFLIMKKKQIYSFGESQIVNCLTDNLETFNLHCDCIYTNEVFKTEYKKLREITWQRGIDKEVYQKRIKSEYPELTDAFDKSKSEKRYNPKTPDKVYSKKELENYSSDEEWRFLTNPGYTKYAVSSEGRVAFYSNRKYHIIFQDDNNGDGYLHLDPNGEYNLDHNIEVYKLIAMGFLGKRIGDGYDVHHKINDGYNCRKDNLVLLTRAQHNIVHMSEEQLEKIGNLDEYLNEK